MSFVTFRWTPDGEDLGLDPIDISGNSSATYQLLRAGLDGFSGFSLTHNSTRSPYQDGEKYISSTYDTRSLSFTFQINGSSFEDIINKKKTINQYFVGTQGEGTLTVTMPTGDIYDIDCVPDGAPIFNDMVTAPDRVRCTIFLQAFSPFFYDPSENSYNLELFDGGFSIPFSVPFTLGTYGMATLTNGGHVDTPVTITVNGPTTNPVIENERTGEKISVTKTLLTDEQLIISTDPTDLSVTYIEADSTETSLMSGVSSDSEFWQLKPGDNCIKISDSTTLGDNPMVFEWYCRFGGIL